MKKLNKVLMMILASLMIFTNTGTNVRALDTEEARADLIVQNYLVSKTGY